MHFFTIPNTDRWSTERDRLIQECTRDPDPDPALIRLGIVLNQSGYELLGMPLRLLVVEMSAHSGIPGDSGNLDYLSYLLRLANVHVLWQLCIQKRSELAVRTTNVWQRKGALIFDESNLNQIEALLERLDLALAPEPCTPFRDDEPFGVIEDLLSEHGLLPDEHEED